MRHRGRMIGSVCSFFYHWRYFLILPLVCFVECSLPKSWESLACEMAFRRFGWAKFFTANPSIACSVRKSSIAVGLSISSRLQHLQLECASPSMNWLMSSSWWLEQSLQIRLDLIFRGSLFWLCLKSLMVWFKLAKALYVLQQATMIPARECSHFQENRVTWAVKWFSICVITCVR